MKKLYALILCAALAAGAAEAETVEYSMNYTGATPQWTGFDKAQTYSVAIRLDQPGMQGKRITALEVPVPEGANLSDCCGWLSSQLKEKTSGTSKVNAPDICSVAGQVSDGVLRVTFAEPYEIPVSGVYVGYSLTVAEASTQEDRNPIAVVPGYLPDGLWMQSTVSQMRWADLGERRQMASAMRVTLEGDFPQNAAVMTLAENYPVVASQASEIEVDVINLGLEPLSSIGYTLEYDGRTEQGTAAINVTGGYGWRHKVSLPVEAPAQYGQIPVTGALTAVNESANPLGETQSAGALDVIPFKAVARPLVEEFTGLTCGWCPRGYVMLEQGKYYHGDEFVGISYHSTSFEQGAMVIMENSAFPVRATSFPAAAINRGDVIDPGKVLGLWGEYRTLAEGRVSAEARWQDDAHTVIEGSVSASFIHSLEEAGYTLSVALIADGLSNEKWLQHNAFATNRDEFGCEGPFWDLFVDTEQWIAGLVYNDVVVYYRDVKGIEGSLPSTIEAGEEYGYTFTIPVADVVNIKGECVVKDFDKTRVVAMILAKNGRVVDACSSSYLDGEPFTGIETVAESAGEPVATEYYTLQGQRLSAPCRGIVIRVDRYGDGSIRASKQISTI